MADAEVHEVVITHCVYGGNNDLLNFGIFVPQVDILDGIIPMNPASFSFKLCKRLQYDLQIYFNKTETPLNDYQNHTVPHRNSQTPGLPHSWDTPISPHWEG